MGHSHAKRSAGELDRGYAVSTGRASAASDQLPIRSAKARITRVGPRDPNRAEHKRKEPRLIVEFTRYAGLSQRSEEREITRTSGSGGRRAGPAPIPKLTPDHCSRTAP